MRCHCGEIMCVALNCTHCGDVMPFECECVERRWISVNDRLPEQQTPVLTVTKIKLFGVNWHIKGLWSTGGGITHWMPLPPLPDHIPDAWKEVQG